MGTARGSDGACQKGRRRHLCCCASQPVAGLSAGCVPGYSTSLALRSARTIHIMALNASQSYVTTSPDVSATGDGTEMKVRTGHGLLTTLQLCTVPAPGVEHLRLCSFSVGQTATPISFQITPEERTRFSARQDPGLVDIRVRRPQGGRCVAATTAPVRQGAKMYRQGVTVTTLYVLYRTIGSCGVWPIQLLGNIRRAECSALHCGELMATGPVILGPGVFTTLAYQMFVRDNSRRR
ncbi:hypothetical protein BD413DRAFT_516374 [Trametes elegans]|nr:hypothetical protein BD413DRAFT_516374 [Trametes elegans]